MAAGAEAASRSTCGQASWPWTAACPGAAGLSLSPPGPAMGDRERNRKRLLELLQAAGSSAYCADCGAARVKVGGACGTLGRPRPRVPSPLPQTGESQAPARTTLISPSDPSPPQPSPRPVLPPLEAGTPDLPLWTSTLDPSPEVPCPFYSPPSARHPAHSDHGP